MKNSITIKFSSREDMAFALGQIEAARKRTEEMKPYGGTPLSGAAASILLCAIGRSEKVKCEVTPEQAKLIRTGRIVINVIQQ